MLWQLFDPWSWFFLFRIVLHILQKGKKSLFHIHANWEFLLCFWLKLWFIVYTGRTVHDHVMQYYARPRRDALVETKMIILGGFRLNKHSRTLRMFCLKSTVSPIFTLLHIPQIHYCLCSNKNHSVWSFLSQLIHHVSAWHNIASYGLGQYVFLHSKSKF